MKKLATIFFFTFLLNQLNCQVICFEKTIEGAAPDILNCIKSTKDGNYIMCGSFGLDVATNQILIAKIDMAGSLIWQKKYTAASDLHGYNIIQCSDNGYLISGRQYVGGNAYDAFVLKIDSMGNFTWSKTLGTDYDDSFLNAEQTPDGGYIFTGYSYNTNGNNYKDILLAKTDSYGNLQWSKLFSGPGDDEGFSVFKSGDGGYLLCGYTYNSPIGFFAIKTNSTGVLKWTKKYGAGVMGTDFGGAQLTSDGGLVLTGGILPYSGSDYDVLLLKADSLGNETWARKYGTAYYNAGSSVLKTNDNGYVITSCIQLSGPPWNNSLIIKTNNSGAIQWSKAGGIGSASPIRSIVESADNGYIFVGDAIQGSNDDMYIVKTDSQGNGGCTFSSTTIFDSTFTVPVYIPTWATVTHTLISNNSTLTPGGAELINTYCTNVNVNELSKNQDIKLFPNPSNGKVTISGLNSHCLIAIWDILGNLIYSKKNEGESTDIDISAESKGIYFYQISDENGFIKNGKLYFD